MIYANHLRTVLLTSIFLLAFVNIKAQTYNVIFRIDMSAETVSANGVHIAGSFQLVAGLGNNWDPSSTLVQDANGDKIYEITIALPSGTYEYKFINGNAWGMDENPHHQFQKILLSLLNHRGLQHYIPH